MCIRDRSQVVPAEIDPLKLLAVPLGSLPRWPRLNTVSAQSERFPGCLELGLVRARGGAEHVRIGAELRSTLEDGGESSLGIERDSPVLLVLGGRARDPDLENLPVDPSV